MKALLSLLLAALMLSACAPTPIPRPTLAPTLTASSTPTASATATETPTPTETPIPVSAVCTPLLDHDLADLPKYITQPLILPLGSNKETGHHGVDFAYYRRDGVGEHIQGTPIQSVLDSVVAGLGYTTVYGNYIILETPYDRLPPTALSVYELEAGQSLYLLYGHMEAEAPFAIGDALACGEQVGNVGGSGDPYFVTDPHLHLETRSGPPGIQFAAMDYYNTGATEEEKAEYEFWRISDTFTLLDPMLLLEAGQ